MSRGLVLVAFGLIALLWGRRRYVVPAARAHQRFALAEPATLGTLSRQNGREVKLTIAVDRRDLVALPGSRGVLRLAPGLCADLTTPHSDLLALDSLASSALLFVVGQANVTAAGVALRGSSDAPLLLSDAPQAAVEAGATSRWLFVAIAVYGIAGSLGFLALRDLLRSRVGLVSGRR